VLGVSISDDLTTQLMSILLRKHHLLLSCNVDTEHLSGRLGDLFKKMQREKEAINKDVVFSCQQSYSKDKIPIHAIFQLAILANEQL
jgi:hypothetical protein